MERVGGPKLSAHEDPDSGGRARAKDVVWLGRLRHAGLIGEFEVPDRQVMTELAEQATKEEARNLHGALIERELEPAKNRLVTMSELRARP